MRPEPLVAESPEPASVLIIACGALAREISTLIRLNDWTHVELQCLSAELHNRPEWIPAKLRAAIAKYRDQYAQIFVGYADCGTGGEIDQIIAEEGLERLPGAHCYAFFTGLAKFDQLAAEEIGSFYLTDFLVRHFERLIIRGLKLDQHPELQSLYFAHYRRLVYLAQTDDAELAETARQAAVYLGLDFKRVYTGYGKLASGLNIQPVKWRPAA